MTKRNVYKMMDAIEGGSVPLYDAFLLAEELDPLLLYFVLRYLKETYGRDTQGPGGRLLQFLSDYPQISKFAATPKNEPMIEWFDESYSVRSFKTREDYLETIIDKLEG
ncbi:MAG: hypothetical protein KA436_08670 [Oligoflexales bacterium]|nr:hypothetical protein [Oligoflexales bacterium]